MGRLFMFMWVISVVYYWILVMWYHQVTSMYYFIAFIVVSLLPLSIPFFNVWACYKLTVDTEWVRR